MEVCTQKAKPLNRTMKTPEPRRGCISVERVDVLPPDLQLLSTLVSRLTLLIIGDVVDRPAERVNLKHGFALRARQNPHRRVKRATRRPCCGRLVMVVHECQRESSRILRLARCE
jgi:hypothetical protein